MEYKQDSRKVNKGDIFLALKGENSNGHLYIDKALELGASKIIYDDAVYANEIPSDKGFYVQDVEKWLHSETANKINDSKVVAITGSVGKTTTLRIVEHLIRNINNNYRNSIYTPITGINTLRGICIDILNRYNSEKLVLLEAGMDYYLELDDLAKVLRPSIAAIINVDISHIEKLETLERISRTKFGLCTSDKMELLIVDSRDGNSKNYLEDNYKKLINEGIFRKSLITEINKDNNLSKVLGVTMPIEKFNRNLDIALAVCEGLGITLSSQELRLALYKFEFKDKRFEIIKNDKFEILNDCYNAAPKSFELFFDYVENLKITGEKLGIIGQIFEIGELSKQIHQNVRNKSLEIFDFVIFVGEQFEPIEKPKKCLFVKNYQEANEKIEEIARNYTFIGIKGSRGNYLENCTNLLLGISKNK